LTGTRIPSAPPEGQEIVAAGKAGGDVPDPERGCRSTCAAASRHANDLDARAAEEFAGDAVTCGAWPGGALAKPGPSLH